MIVDWTGETFAWIVLGVSTFYLAARLVIGLVRRTRHRARVKPYE